MKGYGKMVSISVKLERQETRWMRLRGSKNMGKEVSKSGKKALTPFTSKKSVMSCKLERIPHNERA